MNKLYIGFMSGTSLDGLDASIIKTDGKNNIIPIENLHIPYKENFRNKLKRLLDFKINVGFFDVEQELTSLHITATYELLQKAKLKSSDIEALGFHGQTIYHNPEKFITWQIGNPFVLAAKTGIKTIYDFRKRDMAYGGQGAPLIPIFHKAIMSDEELPVAIINIGGVANITYIDKDELVAFDTGPGNALIDDACLRYYGQVYDKNGEIARAGKADTRFVEEVLKGEYFAKPYPKSLDRNEFKWVLNRHCEESEGRGNPMRQEVATATSWPRNDDFISTLTYLTAASIADSLKLLPKVPRKIYLCGGGVHNSCLKELIADLINKNYNCDVLDINYKSSLRGVRRTTRQSPQVINALMSWDHHVGSNEPPRDDAYTFNPDFIESQGFAYLAARFCNNLPSSFPSTTGASKPTICGAAVAAS